MKIGPRTPHGDVLTHIRDIAAGVAYRIGTLNDGCVRAGAAPSQQALDEVAGLNAAADIVQFLLTAGLAAKLAGRDAPQYVLGAVAQARSGYLVEEGKAASVVLDAELGDAA